MSIFLTFRIYRGSTAVIFSRGMDINFQNGEHGKKMDQSKIFSVHQESLSSTSDNEYISWPIHSLDQGEHFRRVTLQIISI